MQNWLSLAEHINTLCVISHHVSYHGYFVLLFALLILCKACSYKCMIYTTYKQAAFKVNTPAEFVVCYFWPKLSLLWLWEGIWPVHWKGEENKENINVFFLFWIVFQWCVSGVYCSLWQVGILEQQKKR